MSEAELSQTLCVLIFVGLRIAPVLAFAPPFTLVRIPPAIRVMLSFGLAGWLLFALPASVRPGDIGTTGLVLMAGSELFIGLGLALTLQLAFAAMLVAGRAIDVQAGFGLAAVVDPTSGNQMPLIGTLFSYAAGAIFFSMGGANDLLSIWARSLSLMPPGSAFPAPDLAALLGFLSAAFFIAIGLAGTVLLALFLVDICVAFLSRTLPQMNVLLIGFQIKTLTVLATLPLAIAFSASTFFRLIRLALDSSLRLF